jgi:hypothetical protein
MLGLVPLQFFMLANVTCTVEYFKSPVQMGEDDNIVDFILKAKMQLWDLLSHQSHISFPLPYFSFRVTHLVCLVFKHSNSVVKKVNLLVVDAVR